ncbi:hypothetical protein KIW84_062115 [Lathyrus oleraceus]|uniref:Uncharacterized protein n=1 Tax=Pisum sativum TaxID=3888 RepID=A0A9D4W6F3_PEA|nr:hypothetical protein KIW84_062115 [Pisum sativum]
MRRVERDNEKQDGYVATCLAAANGNQNMEGLEEATISHALHRIHMKNGAVTREGMTGVSGSSGAESCSFFTS